MATKGAEHDLTSLVESTVEELWGAVFEETIDVENSDIIAEQSDSVAG